MVALPALSAPLFVVKTVPFIFALTAIEAVRRPFFVEAEHVCYRSHFAAKLKMILTVLQVTGLAFLAPPVDLACFAKVRHLFVAVNLNVQPTKTHVNSPTMNVEILFVRSLTQNVAMRQEALNVYQTKNLALKRPQR